VQYLDWDAAAFEDWSAMDAKEVRKVIEIGLLRFHMPHSTELGALRLKNG
jgi:hypothetical protein